MQDTLDSNFIMEEINYDLSNEWDKLKYNTLYWDIKWSWKVFVSETNQHFVHIKWNLYSHFIL